MLNRTVKVIAACAFACALSPEPARAQVLTSTTPDEEEQEHVSSTSTSAAEAAQVFTQRALRSRTPTVAVGLPIEIDPTNHSVCTVQTGGDNDAAEDGEEDSWRNLPAASRSVTLSLEGMKWSGWEGFCEKLIKYLRPDTSPLEPELPRDTERLLAETGFFAAVTCTATISTAELSCAMTPQPLVKGVDIGGGLPFVLIEEDIRRQMFLRPGTPIYEEREVLEKQRARLEDYLERTGFFNSKAKVTATHGQPDAEPNEGINLRAEVDAGPSANLRKITIEGDPGVPADEIDDRLRHYWIFSIFPRRFQPQQFDEDLEEITRYMQSQGWPEAHVSGEYIVDGKAGSVDVVLHVQTGPKLALKFEGNHFMSDEDLSEQATFAKAGSADIVEIENTVKAIIRKYQGEGFYQVRVESRTELRGDAEVSASTSTGAEAAMPATARRGGTREIIFSIEEGPRAEVSELIIEGNKAFDGETILDEGKLKTKASSGLKTGRWMDENVERDKRSIRRIYRLAGYAITTVQASHRTIDREHLEVKFEIDEGPRRMVKSLVFRGLPKSMNEADLKERLRLVENAPYVETRLMSDRREILTQLAANGYPRAQVSRKMKLPYKTGGGDVSIEYVVDAGPLSTFGGFLVRGNFRTAESVIGYELEIDPGQPLNLLTLSEARQRLRSLGVFSSVDLRPLDQWLGSRETWLVIDIAERDQRALDVVLSFATDTRFAVGADFKDPNFLGRAIHLNLSARLSNASELIVPEARIGNVDMLNGRLEAPHPLGLPFNSEVTAFYQLQNSNFYEKKIGWTAAISKVLLPDNACSVCPEITGRFGYELSAVEGAIEPGAEISPVPIARLVPGISHRKIDSPIDPRSGYSGDLRFELANHYFAGPIRDAPNFWRFIVNESGYLTLGEPFTHDLSETMKLGGPVVLAGNIEYGIAHPYAGGFVPFTESMYYGGDSSVRGLADRASRFAFPDSHYGFTSSAELRWYFLQGSFGSLQIAALTDYGTVSQAFSGLFQSNTVTAGGAFRWLTPVGPLSIAYAVPVVRPPELLARPDVAPDSGRLHIYFGYTF